MAINSKCLLLTGSGVACSKNVCERETESASNRAGDIFSPTKRPSYLQRSWPCDLLSLSSYVESDCGHSYHATWDVRATQSFGSDEGLVSAKLPRWTVSRKRALNTWVVFWIQICRAVVAAFGLQKLPSQPQCNSNCAPKKRAFPRAREMRSVHSGSRCPPCASSALGFAARLLALDVDELLRR